MKCLLFRTSMGDISKWIMVLNCWWMVIWNISTVLPCGEKKTNNDASFAGMLFFFSCNWSSFDFQRKSHLAAEFVMLAVGSSKAVYEHEQLSGQPRAKTRVSNVITLSGAHQPTRTTKFVLNLFTTYEMHVSLLGTINSLELLTGLKYSSVFLPV